MVSKYRCNLLVSTGAQEVGSILSRAFNLLFVGYVQHTLRSLQSILGSLIERSKILTAFLWEFLEHHMTFGDNSFLPPPSHKFVTFSLCSWNLVFDQTPSHIFGQCHWIPRFFYWKLPLGAHLKFKAIRRPQRRRPENGVKSASNQVCLSGALDWPWNGLKWP